MNFSRSALFHVKTRVCLKDLKVEIRFLGKFGPNIKNCHFKLKLVLDLDEYAEIYGSVLFLS